MMRTAIGLALAFGKLAHAQWPHPEDTTSESTNPVVHTGSYSWMDAKN